MTGRRELAGQIRSLLTHIEKHWRWRMQPDQRRTFESSSEQDLLRQAHQSLGGLCDLYEEEAGR